MLGDFLDVASDAILVHTFHDGIVTYWSSGAGGLYGWPADQVMGRAASELLQTRYPAPLEEIEKALQERGRWQGSLNQRARDGRTLTTLSRWTLQRDPAGNAASVLQINTDITRQSEAEERLRASEEMLTLLLSGVRDFSIFMLDTEGNVITWNEGAERINGYAADEIVGRHFSAFFSDEDVHAGRPGRTLRLAASEGRYEEEAVLRIRKDGSTFWASILVTALHDGTGALHGFIKVTRDTTARREEEERRLDQQRQEAEQLRQHAERMEELERAKTEFLNLASHELRGPLVVARGYLSLLEDGSISPDKFATIAPLVSAKVAQMESLVQHLLETARLDHDQLDLTMELADLRDVVREQLQVAERTASPRHHLELHLPSRPVLVKADLAQIAAVVLNLIDNAIKYSPEGGLVRVGVTLGSNRAFVTVLDEGVGIAPDQAPKLFSRFARLDNPSTRTVGGTGLGLYLGREIARRHGGDIHFDSEQGIGTRFTLSLPRQTA
jgi:PAS domain S-box-containing protein